MTHDDRERILNKVCDGNTLNLDYSKFNNLYCTTCRDEGFVEVDRDGLNEYLVATYMRLGTKDPFEGCYGCARKDIQFWQKHGQVPCRECS